jgi:hypothetical protein
MSMFLAVITRIEALQQHELFIDGLEAANEDPPVVARLKLH